MKDDVISIMDRMNQRTHILIDIVNYVSRYAIKHDDMDLLKYINEKLTEIQEVGV